MNFNQYEYLEKGIFMDENNLTEQEKIKAYLESLAKETEQAARTKSIEPMQIDPIERRPVEILQTDKRKSNKNQKNRKSKSMQGQIDEDEIRKEQKIQEFLIQERMKNDRMMQRKKPKRKSPKKKKKVIIVLAIVIPIVLILAGLGWFGYSNLKSAKENVSNLKDSAEQFLNYVQAKDTPNSEKAFIKLCESTDKVDKMLESPFFKIVSIVPKVKHEIGVARELVDMVSDAEVNLLSPLVDKMKEYPLTELKVGDGFNTRLMNAYLDFLEEKQPYLEDMLTKIDSLDPDSLIGGYIGEKKAKIYELVDSYHEATTLLPLLRTIIGDGSDRLYMLVAQNSAEIRASGGFPGSMGTIKIKDGILTIGDFNSVYNVLTRAGLPADSGLDYEDYVFGSAWLENPWDACFIPEFTKTARIWATSYRDGRWTHRYEDRQSQFEQIQKNEEAKQAAIEAGQPYEEKTVEMVPDEYFENYNYYMETFHVDGVISMTPAIIQMMLEDVGEITLSDGTTLNGQNATKVLQHDLYYKYFNYIEEYPYYAARADELFAETAKAAMKGFVGNFEVSKFSYYYKLFKTGIEKRIIQMWMEDDAEEQVILEAQAGGTLNYDAQNPYTGIYFSLSDPSKLGWYMDIVPEISEPVVNEDGSKTYDVNVTFRNTIAWDEIAILRDYVTGSYGGTLIGYAFFMAPAGGYIMNEYTDQYLYLSRSMYHGLDLAYTYNINLDPGETLNVHYQVVTPPGVEAPLKVVTTPTLTEYRTEE